MPALKRAVVPAIVSQHAEDAAVLRSTRSVLVRSPHVELHRLARHDERLYGHLDGALIAGDDGYRMALEALENPSVGQLFVVAVLAIERRDLAQIEKLLALIEAVPDAAQALASAFGWVSAEALRGLTASLLRSPSPLKRWLGIAACAAHRVDPGRAFVTSLSDEHPMLRRQALRAAGQLGRTDLMPQLLARLDDADRECRVAAAWSAVLLGDRRQAWGALRNAALDKDSSSPDALQMCLLSAEPETARDLVRELAAARAPLRTMIRAAAWAGDVMVVPWLIKQMADDAHARVAGEAFSALTGADLALLDLERKGETPSVGGPSENPDDDDVSLDEDESLPWSDIDAVQAWWDRNAGAMRTGVRVLEGLVATDEHCLHVLKTKGQRQRRVAALLQSLGRPGTTLFNTAAPAARQRRLLGLARLAP